MSARLRPLLPEEFDHCAERAWRLAQDPARSSYPTYADGVKTREDFFAAARRAQADPGSEILLYQAEGSEAGWLQYQRDDEGLTAAVFCPEDRVAQALTDFVDHVRARHPGLRLELGLPTENRQGCAAMERLGFAVAEASGVYLLRYPLAAPPQPNPAAERVTRETFSRFRRLHDPRSEGMYWTSRRLEEACFAPGSLWRLYLSGDLGAVCFHLGKISEIFSVDYPEGRFSLPALLPLMGQAIWESRRAGAEALYFFAEDDRERRLAQAAGMPLAGDYRLYRKTL